MKDVGKSLCILLWGSLLVALFVGCASAPALEGSRREFDYVPPVFPAEVPEPVKTVVEPEEQSAGESEVEMDSDEIEVEKEPSSSKGFFSRIFSRENSGQSTSTVERVGDQREQMVDEEGVAVQQGPADSVYRIRAGDAMIITLTGSGGLSEQIETVVDDQGAVKLRFIGAVPAEGLTTTELEREIELEYTERQQIYRNVTARAVVPNTFYFIGGEVRQPGRFPIIGRVTLSQAVVAAGNFTEWANDRRIILVRNNERNELDFRNISRNPLQDVELLAGDVITVTRSTF